MRLALIALVALGACTSQSERDKDAANESTVNVDAIDSITDPAVRAKMPREALAPAPGTRAGLANDMTPVSEAPFTDDSAQGGANVVQRYYARIEQGEYAQAWALWQDGGKASGMTADAFAASFGKYSEYHADIGAPSDVDAGAGQRYVTVPVVVYGKMKDGTGFNLKGSVTLQRTEVDGATPEQRHWHIRSSDLKPVAP